MFKKTLTIILILVQAFLYISCSNKMNNIAEKNSFHMGTIISEKIYGENAEKAADDVMERIKQLDSMMTVNSPGSEIDKLNEMAGKDKVRLSSESIYVLENAKKFSELYEGAFDVTVGPLVKAWGVITDHPRVPAQDEINSLLKLVDYKDINIDSKNNTAMLAREGQSVDLGGIAKGYAGDEAIKILKEDGIKSGYISLGGNIVVLGNKPDGTPWNIGIQNPRAENGKYIGIVKVSDKAVVTSGDYQRYFEEDGVRYHHILDPKTGYPSNSGLISTTIITDKSIDADALAKTFVLGLDKGMKFIESLNGVEAIFVTSDKKVYITKGLKDVFKFEDETNEFQYVEKR
jgi:FAD:protein FMN transferase